MNRWIALVIFLYVMLLFALITIVRGDQLLGVETARGASRAVMWFLMPAHYLDDSWAEPKHKLAFDDDEAELEAMEARNLEA